MDAVAIWRLGADKSATETLLRVLEQMKYQIRTVLDISEAEFSTCVDWWVLGTPKIIHLLVYGYR